MNSFAVKRLIPVLLLGAVYVGYVIYPLTETLRESVNIGGAFSVANYINILSPGNSANFEALWNSIVVSILSVLFSGILGTFLAFVLTQFTFPLQRLLTGLAVLPIALPPLVGVIAFLFAFGESGILPRIAQEVSGMNGNVFALEGFSAIVAVHTYSFYVYFYLFVSTTLRQLDAAQLEAAQTLGSTTLRTLRAVVLPELKPALLGAAILTFMASMASFSAPLLFGGDMRFMTLQIYNAKLNGELDVAASHSVVLAAVSITFYILLKIVTPRTSGVRRSKGTGRSGLISLPIPVRRVLIACCIALLALELLPIAIIILISFAKEGSWTWQILPAAYTSENYHKLFADPHVFDPIINSSLMSLVAVTACILVGVSISYLLVKGSLRRVRHIGDVLATLSFAIPGTVIALSLILAFNSPGIFTAQTVLVGTFWILPLAYFIRMFPFVVRSTSASLDQLDDSLLEAGESFGAGSFRRFRKIVLPGILPGIVAGALLVIITAIGEFVSSVLLYTYSNRPISVEILAQMRTYNFGAAAAYSVFLLILVMVLSVLAGLVGREEKSHPSPVNI
ncbi:MAG: iron ABC transporter permease [Bacteroidetes bacterium]|nr:iron ABC transporter permease [Bacteroidota bacterium]MCW5897400.1 iron ABC transporter permease [Bacteroidota bacterium]